MRTLLTTALLFLTTTNVSADYTLGIDSLPQGGVPQGMIEKRIWESSSIYPGTTTDYWIYVPAQYNEATPACVMVF